MGKKRSSSESSNVVADDDDLISKLPNELLVRILSFTDTKSAVATTFLSKRWNRLWIGVPALDLMVGWLNRPEKKDRHEQFVDRVLASNNVVPVRLIRLLCWESTQAARLNSWLASIARRDAETIWLILEPNIPYHVPDLFFVGASKRLVQLSIGNFVCLVPKSVCFPSLREILFNCLYLRDHDSLKNLLSGCPVLKHLYMVVVEWDPELITSLDVTSSSLLTLDVRIDSDRLKAPSGYKVVIDAPNVEKLLLYDHIGVSYHIRSFSSFKNISLRFGESGLVLWELLKRMIHARELYLTFVSKAPFNSSLQTMPVFGNLIKLDLVLPRDEYWPCVFRLLHCAPSLVTFDLYEFDDVVPNCIWEEPNEVPRCFVSSLERIEMVLYAVKNVKSMQMISYILRNATVLKNMYLHITKIEMEEENEFRTNLSTLQKSSSECQVIYEDEDEWGYRIYGARCDDEEE